MSMEYVLSIMYVNSSILHTHDQEYKIFHFNPQDPNLKYRNLKPQIDPLINSPVAIIAYTSRVQVYDHRSPFLLDRPLFLPR